jgi:hypothetical protein
MAAPVTSDAGDNFGPIARVVTEREHVYTTVVTAGRWAVAIGVCVVLGILAWMARSLFQADVDADPLDRYLWAPILGVFGLAALVLGFLVLYARAQLTLSPAGITLRRRGLLFGRPAVLHWKIDQLAAVVTDDMATFHVGGSTPIFGVILGLTTGDIQKFGGAFDDAPSAKRAATAIAESARLMGAPT